MGAINPNSNSAKFGHPRPVSPCWRGSPAVTRVKRSPQTIYFVASSETCRSPLSCAVEWRSLRSTVNQVAWRLAVALLLLVAARAQDRAASAPQKPVPKSPLLAYAGNWSGTFQGKQWVLLNLSLAGDKFTGSLQHPRNIQLNDDGELKTVSEEDSREPVVDAKLNPDGLLLSVKNPESQETERYQMRLTGDSSAELKMLAMSMPPGLPKPKPWKLSKLH